MRGFTLAASALVFGASLAAAQTTTWMSDPNHSEVDFAIAHMSVSKVHGRFGNVNATVQYDPANVTRSTVKATIGVGTVDTGIQGRDNDLRGPKYFDIAAFPVATFTSTSVAKTGDHLSVSGNLSLHGITNPVVLDVEGPTAPVTDQQNRVHRGFSASTTIHRSDFGIAPQVPTAMLGDDVTLTIELDVVRQ